MFSPPIVQKGGDSKGRYRISWDEPEEGGGSGATRLRPWIRTIRTEFNFGNVDKPKFPNMFTPS